MLYPFKISGGIPAETALLGDTDLKDYCTDLADNMSWSGILPHVRKVVRDELIPHIGHDFYTAIVTAIHGDTLTEEQLVVADLLRDYVAAAAVVRLLPGRNISVSDMGVTQAASKDATLSPADGWRYYHRIWTLRKEADGYLDGLLDYCHRYAAELPSFDPDLLTEGKLFVRSLTEVERWVFLNRSHRTYRALVPSITRVQRHRLRPLLGRDQYDVFVATYRTGQPAPLADELLDRVREYVTILAVRHALSSLSLLVESGGIYRVSTTEGMRRNLATANETALAKFDETLATDEATAERALLAYLHENRETYPLWHNHVMDRQRSSDNVPLQLGGGGVFVG